MDSMNHNNICKKSLLFEGELSFIGLSDVFQILGGNNSTGVLHLTSPYTEVPACVYFKNGNPVNADFGALRGIDAIYALFGWIEGNFEFHHGEIDTKCLVEQSRMQIVLDALRMLDDGLIKKVGSPSFIDCPGIRHDSECGLEGTPAIIKGPLVDYMYLVQEEFISDGDRIVTEGAYGNWVWVVLEGRVKITRETMRGPVTLAQLGEGCFIGTFTSFLFKDYIRTATATATGNVHLGLLDTQRLAGEFASLSNDFRKFFLCISDRLREVSDQTIHLVSDKKERQEPEEVRGFVAGNIPCKKGRMITLMPGRNLFHENPEGSLFPWTPLRKEEVLMSALAEPSRSSAGYPIGFQSCDRENDLSKMESLKGEYETLSRTFKNMVDNLASCIAATTTVAHHLCEGGQVLIENPKP